MSIFLDEGRARARKARGKGGQRYFCRAYAFRWNSPPWNGRVDRNACGEPFGNEFQKNCRGRDVRRCDCGRDHDAGKPWSFGRDWRDFEKISLNKTRIKFSSGILTAEFKYQTKLRSSHFATPSSSFEGIVAVAIFFNSSTAFSTA